MAVAAITKAKRRVALRRRPQRLNPRAAFLSTEWLLQFMAETVLVEVLSRTRPYLYWGRCDRCGCLDRLRAVVKRRLTWSPAPEITVTEVEYEYVCRGCFNGEGG